MNQLSKATSPYLLQHAQNPVHWHQWDSDALAKAKRENKPIFLSIGYSACHWCHVMAHESFEDETTAVYMNEHFINIKVDREERPDLDTIYMQATVAMTGAGGWPMSVFLTPDLHPFYAGTYFPPVPKYNMPSFMQLLQGIAQTWSQNSQEAFRVGNEVTKHIEQSLNINADSQQEISLELIEAAENNIIDSYDWGNGGWGSAPKFPQPMTIELLLNRHAAGSKNAIKPAVHALISMARGGMYDVVGGGFSRYSVDNYWRVPHFEKMLYDNSQLISVYLHGWQVTKDPYFKQVVIDSLEFVSREMTHPEGGFYSSLDADSEDVEGKFYVWNLEEISFILGDDSKLFEAAYGITSLGNWEGNTVLQRALDTPSLAARFKLDEDTVSKKLKDCHNRLLFARSSRIRPATDDKILTSWNGLMLSTIAEASRVFEEDGLRRKYTLTAIRNANFLLKNLRPNNQLKHSWRNGITSKEVFLEDYGSLILGFLKLYQSTLNNTWYALAVQLADEMIEQFEDPQGGFFDTPNGAESLLIRPKDTQDNATPSGNSLACAALIKLFEFSGKNIYRELAEKGLQLVMGMAGQYPTAFAHWLSAAENVLGKSKQVAVLYETNDNRIEEITQFIQSQYKPNIVFAISSYPPPEDAPPIFKDRYLIDGKPTIYVCENFVCQNPITNIEELSKLL